MIEELSKNHPEWLRMATFITKSRYKADDLVQDMYLKIHASKKKDKITNGYVYSTLHSIFIDGKRKDKRDKVYEDLEIPDQVYIEPDHKEKELLHRIVEHETSKLKWHEKEIINLSSQIGIRPLAREAGISKEIIVKVRKKLKENSQKAQVMLSKLSPSEQESYLVRDVIREPTG